MKGRVKIKSRDAEVDGSAVLPLRLRLMKTWGGWARFNQIGSKHPGELKLTVAGTCAMVAAVSHIKP
jgi:hypothetical protein